MSRWQIYEVVTDSDGVDCYIKRGEVVRCRECKWHNEREGCFFSTAEVDADDFCSYGERSSE